MPNKMATMRGCCTCGSPLPCSSCECTTGSEAITLAVSAVPLKFVGIDECDETGYADVLAGLKEMVPWSGCSTGAAPDYCSGGCYAAACQNGNAPKVIGFHYVAAGLLPNDGVFVPDPNDIDALEDCAFFTHVWQARWFMSVDRAAKKLSVFLALHWIGAYGCPAACRSFTVGYIRWEYDFDSCSSIAHPAHVRTMIWHAWQGESESTDEGDAVSYCPCTAGSTGFLSYLTGVGGEAYSGVCSIQETEVPANVGDWFGSPCGVFTSPSSLLDFPSAPSEGVYLKVHSLTPPAVSIAGCQDACCGTKGGPPTAVIELGEVNACFVTATDASTPGTCGPIVKRLWILESWDSEPTTSADLACADKQTVVSSDDVGLEGSEGIFKPVTGCGKKWWRLTLIVWDSQDCFDKASTDVQTCCNCEDEGEPCPGVPGGSLSVEEIDLCQYELCATLPVDEFGHADGVCGEGTPFIEWQLNTGACSFTDDCPCEDTPISGGCSVIGCSGGLGDGDCYTITLTQSAVLRWRVWDNVCGCPGPWNEQILECSTCHCCDGTLVRVEVTVSGISEGNNGPDIDCHNCTEVNRTYVMRPILDCRFWYTSVEHGGEPSVVCDDSSIPFTFNYGTEVLFDMDCSDRGGGDRAIYLSGQILAGACTNTFGEVTIDAPGDIIPMDCSGILTGCLPNNGECSLGAETNCNSAAATFCYTLYFA